MTEPGSDEWVTLGGIAEALFVFRQGGVQEQFFVRQHSQYWFFWTVSYLHKFVTMKKKSFKLSELWLSQV